MFCPVLLKLFSESLDMDDNVVSIKCRIVKQLDLNDNSQKFIDDIARGFESIEGVDGRIEWSEKVEGSASYLRLINEIPKFKRRTDI